MGERWWWWWWSEGEVGVAWVGWRDGGGMADGWMWIMGVRDGDGVEIFCGGEIVL